MHSKILLLRCCGLPLAETFPADAAVRDTISINQGWQFHRGDVKNIAELKSLKAGMMW